MAVPGYPARHQKESLSGKHHSNQEFLTYMHPDQELLFWILGLRILKIEGTCVYAHACVCVYTWLCMEMFISLE